MPSEAPEKRFKDLQDRLTALQDATHQLQELIDRLANFDFQPGSVPLTGTATATASTGEDNVAAELSTEINQILREQEEDLELLREEIVDIRIRPTGGSKPPASGRSGSGGGSGGGNQQQHDKQRLEDGAARLGQELQSCRRYFRKAQIAAKRNLELAQRQERELLYASFSSPRSGTTSPGAVAEGASGGQPQSQLQQKRKQYKSREPQSKEDRLVGASHDVTQSLRQTHDLMASELSRSEFAHRTLTESTRALADLSESYAGLDSLLATSRDLLGALFRSQKTDTWYLETSFWLLVATVAWLVFRRWLYGPLWWLVWLPLQLVFRGGAAVVSSAVAARRGDASQLAAGSGSGDVWGTQSSVLQQASMNNEGAPTIRVGQDATVAAATPSQQQPAAASSSGERGSVADEVGRIIDQSQEGGISPPGDGSAEGSDNAGSGGNGQGQGQGQGGTVLRERAADERPNPRKRMMEGEAPPSDEDPGMGNGKDRGKDEL